MAGALPAELAPLARRRARRARRGRARSAPARASLHPPLPEAARRTYRQDDADIALAPCVAQAYASEPRAKDDAIASAGGIDAWSNFDLEGGHDAMASLIAQYLARDYPSYQGPQIRLDLMKCIDMYHGKELAAQVGRFAPAPNRSYENDNPPTKR
ncbi:MAG: T6SS amidase immunity protein Tai4 family protein [Roseiarcus sp.]